MVASQMEQKSLLAGLPYRGKLKLLLDVPEVFQDFSFKLKLSWKTGFLVKETSKLWLRLHG